MLVVYDYRGRVQLKWRDACRVSRLRLSSVGVVKDLLLFELRSGCLPANSVLRCPGPCVVVILSDGWFIV